MRRTIVSRLTGGLAANRRDLRALPAWVALRHENDAMSLVLDDVTCSIDATNLDGRRVRAERDVYAGIVRALLPAHEMDLHSDLWRLKDSWQIGTRAATDDEAAVLDQLWADVLAQAEHEEVGIDG
jgi:hypothetical protein